MGRALTRLGGRLARSRRLVRTSIVVLNIAILAVIGVLAMRGTQTGLPLGRQAAIAGSVSDSATEPLDQLSSADIAANAAIAARLAETTSVVNLADSARADLNIAPADKTVVTKVQAIATPLKSKDDIKAYTVVTGDTVASIAAKFGVTSDSIMWSNNLTGNAVNAGVTLYIPPQNGIVYTVKAGDTVDSLATKYRANKDQLIAYNDVELTGIKVGERILIPNGQQPAPAIYVSRALVAVYGFNGYDYGWCTWYAAERRSQMGHPVPTGLGNANTWVAIAASMGLPTGSTPQVGAVAMKHLRAPGHVAVVEVVTADGGFWISEMNSYGQKSMTDPTPVGGWGVVDWKYIPPDQVSTYSFIY
ncbi:MAG TPA: LysM peptidoglycan-binding domain-containing protein [Candidatus Saccharimonadales bacterium]|nr:LysM peptidoglycan-binding domain-containing protein [Candidatus Saccharimonadales bacterium]